MNSHRLELFKSEEEIKSAVERIASEISSDYLGKRPVLVCVLGGSFIFLSDLARELTVNIEIDFLKAESYGDAVAPAHEPKLTLYPTIDLKGRDVIIVEDIIDTAATYLLVKAMIEGLRPASLACSSLLYRRGAPVEVQYKGLEVDSGFFVGYGLDYAEEYRALKNLYILNNKG